MTTQETGIQIPKEIHYQMVAYEALAKKINFKDVMPSFPLNPTESTISGFMGRFNNWKQKLMHAQRMNELNVIASKYSEKAKQLVK